MLRSPLGCAFLLAAEAASLSPQECASQRNCLYLCAHATMDVWVRQGELYLRAREELLRQGQRHRDLALAMLEHPAAAWWFGPLDTARQVFVPRGRSAPDPSRFTAPPSPFSTGEYNRRGDSGGLFTSTLVDGTASVFVGLGRLAPFMGGRGRRFQQPPYANWLLGAEPSSRVFEIDSPDAWHDLCVRYPMVADRDSQVPGMEDEAGLLIPDWTAVMADWDAVHLTLGGLLTATQVRVESAAGWTYLWNWPVEQTLWLRWMFDRVERMPDREHEESPIRGFYPFVFRAGLVEEEPPTLTPDNPNARFPDPLPPQQWLPSTARFRAGFRRTNVDFPDLLPPPSEPPDVYLMRPRSDSERQQAILVLSQWTVNGEVVTNSLVGTPISRPAPLEASGSDIVIVRIATESAPVKLSVRHYDQLKPDGHHAGKPRASLGVWFNPRFFSQNARENARLLRYNADGDPPGWEFAVRLAETPGVSYIQLWAQWFMPGQGGVYSANWTMSARR